MGRGLYSLVDWNLIVGANDPSLGVEAYTASWIEIFISRWWCIAPRVEAYTASWIEIDKLYFFISFTSSRLIQPRGLKSICIRWCWETCSRGLYSLVDWNFQSWQCEKRIPRRGLYSLVDWNDGSVWLIASAICRGLYRIVSNDVWKKRVKKIGSKEPWKLQILILESSPRA